MTKISSEHETLRTKNVLIYVYNEIDYDLNSLKFNTSREIDILVFWNRIYHVNIFFITKYCTF
jgi:hypothetical protein